jgi:hypothetical protein
MSGIRKLGGGIILVVDKLSLGVNVLAGLAVVPAALASGSASADLEAELVYVGTGTPADYAANANVWLRSPAIDLTAPGIY